MSISEFYSAMSEYLIEAFGEIPENKYGLRQMSNLIAQNDYLFFDMRKGDMFPIFYDKQYIRYSGLTWDIESLTNEIDHGLWKVDNEHITV